MHGHFRSLMKRLHSQVSHHNIILLVLLIHAQSTGTEPLVNDVVDVMDPTGAWRHGRIVKLDVEAPIPMIKVAYAWCARIHASSYFYSSCTSSRG